MNRKERKHKMLAILLIIFCFISNFDFAASRPPVRARHGVVASVSEIASCAGIEILQQGGNAVDAAVTVALVLAVVWPVAGNLGGGGFMMVRMTDGRSEAIDYRERAPLAATREMYLDEKGDVVPYLSTVGYKAVAVPGTVAGLAFAARRFGRMEWKKLIEPARKLAANGFILNDGNVESICSAKDVLERFSESKRIFFPKDKCPKAGDLFVQSDLARTLSRLQENGPNDFYEGETAHMLVSDMKQNGGIITMEDLKSYEPVVRKPLRGTYHDYEILTMPPPSSGGIVILEMLNMLEDFDMTRIGFQSSDHIHLLAEVMRRAFADRAEYLGDTDFVSVPLEKLTSKKYAAQLARTIHLEKATPSEQIGAGNPTKKESEDTTHFTIVDQEGNIVSNTYTLNDSFGSGATATGTGVLLNNEMDDFTSKPGVPNLFGLIQGEANAITPRKRPLSSMSPTIVLKNGKPYFAVGSPGGPTIINTVLQIIMNIVDFGMDLQQAIDAPRIHHQWMPDQIEFEPFGLNRDTQSALQSRGNKLKERGWIGDAHGIMVLPETGERLGASDPRLNGMAAGY